MTELNFQKCFEDALTKAFASQNARARLAYLDLAEFYERQAQRQARRAGRGSFEIFR